VFGINCQIPFVADHDRIPFIIYHVSCTIHLHAQEQLAAGEAALFCDDLAVALAAGSEAREAAEACGVVPLIRQVEALMIRVETRQHLVLNREEGLKRLSEAEQAMASLHFPAARSALSSAKSLLQVARDEHGLARVAALETEVGAAEASCSSDEALVEAEKAIVRADFGAAQAAAAAARKALVKADRGCEEVDGVDARIAVAMRAAEALAEAEEHIEQCME
jgi:hypothetical protein